jgi:hypothetical protein
MDAGQRHRFIQQVLRLVSDPEKRRLATDLFNDQTATPGAPAEPSTAKRISTFWRSTPIWGGLGVLSGAIASQLSLKLLFVAVWGIFLFEVIRVGFFSGMVRKIVGNLLAGFLLAVIFFYLYRVSPKPKESPTLDQQADAVVDKVSKKFPWLSEPPTKSTTPVDTPKPTDVFLLSQPRTMVNMSGDFTSTLPLWIRYQGGSGQTISPVAVGMFIDITNQTAIPQKIKAYSVAIKTPSCGWTYLSPVSMRSVQVFWMDNVKAAMPMDFSSNGLDFLLERPIRPYGTVSGWWLFDSRDKCPIGVGDAIQYRVTLDTFSGRKLDRVTDSERISNTSPLPGSTERHMTGWTFVVTTIPQDLSHDVVRFYADPVD